MPRNGAGVASPVPGFNTVAASTTILSALHNSGINDIFTILNSAWPVSLGGTGGTTAISSWDAITAKGTDIASASTIVLTTATGPRIDITGVTAITAVTLANGSMRIARATGIFVLTASATLLVNKSASVNYTTAVGDLMIFTAEGGVTSVTVIGSSSSSNTTSNAPFTNFAIGTPTVAASALTIPFTGVDGTALSASNLAYINFRSATAGSGVIAQLALSALASLVISSGSTLGMTSGVAATLALAIFNDAGTARPAIINPLTLPLTDGIASATSEGGAGAADSAGVWYSNAAITSKAYTIVGYITVTEATPGTWATAPSTTQVGQAPAVTNAYQRLVIGTSVATTSGTAISFTGLPGWVKRITIGLSAVSLNGTSSIIARLSTGGSFAATGYLGSGVTLANTSSVTGASLTTGMAIGTYQSAAAAFSGSIIITNVGGNAWVSHAFGGYSPADVASGGGSSITLGGVIDGIRITSLNGTDTFDAGAVNILYEG